jgi:ParB family chromosome partitioning protein
MNSARLRQSQSLLASDDGQGDIMTLEKIRCSDISPDPRNGGSHPKAVEALSESIREHGVLRPVLLRPTSDGYIIVHGECRWRAAQMAGLDAIPAFLVQDITRSDVVTA